MALGDDPGNLGHVQAPWDAAQVLKRWQDETMRNRVTAGPRLLESAGAVQRGLDKLSELINEGLSHVPLEPVLRPLPPLDKLVEMSTVEVPNVPDSWPREETSDMTGRSTARETVPTERSSPSRGTK